MKVLKFSFLCFFLTSIWCCQSDHEVQNELRELSNFSYQELIQIQTLISSLDSVVLDHKMDSSVNAAYRTYFFSNDSSYPEKFEIIMDDLSQPKNMQRFNLAIKGLKSEQIFDDFWVVKSIYYPKTGDTVPEYAINLEGRYFVLLKKLGTQNEVFDNYLIQLEQNGGVSPGMIAQILQLPGREIDFSKDSARLLWAIHYLTVLTQVNKSAFKQLNSH